MGLLVALQSPEDLEAVVAVSSLGHLNSPEEQVELLLVRLLVGAERVVHLVVVLAVRVHRQVNLLAAAVGVAVPIPQVQADAGEPVASPVVGVAAERVGQQVALAGTVVVERSRCGLGREWDERTFKAAGLHSPRMADITAVSVLVGFVLAFLPALRWALAEPKSTPRVIVGYLIVTTVGTIYLLIIGVNAIDPTGGAALAYLGAGATGTLLLDGAARVSRSLPAGPPPAT